MSIRIAVHGGVGEPWDWRDGCEKAAAVGMRLLEDGYSATDAVVVAVASLETDGGFGRFNAGDGGAMRNDGTVLLDAGLMESSGKFMGVAHLSWPKNPILVAQIMMLSTPHHFLINPVPEEYPKLKDLERRSGPSIYAQIRYKEMMSGIKSTSFYNRAAQPTLTGETVGAVACDAQGRFASAASTGGWSLMPKGRVGDVPMMGNGFYADKTGAAAITGFGESIMEQQSAFKVCQLLASGCDPLEACEIVVSSCEDNKEKRPIGIVAIDDLGAAAFANLEMPYAILPE